MTTTMNNTKRKKILMLHGSSDLYGGSKILLITVGILIKNGYSVFVVLDENGPLVAELEKSNAEVIISELGILRRQYMSIKGLMNRVFALKAARSKLIKLVKSNDINIIYSNTTSVLVGCYVAKATKLKHILHVHEIIKNPAFFTKFIAWHLNMFADKVIVVSEEVKKHWEKYVNPSKISVVYNGLNYDTFFNSKATLRDELDLNNGEILIGMVGRVNLWKGQSYFLKMASILAEKYKNLKFVMAGDAFPGYEYLYEQLQLIIKEEQLEDAVYQLGYRTDIPNILKSLDVFVLPSIEPDPLPTVVLEAMASSKPVVATAHGGALEMVVDKVTGIHIPWDNAAAAVDKLTSIIENKDMRITMGEKGRQRVQEKFSYDQYEKNILQLLKSV